MKNIFVSLILVASFLGFSAFAKPGACKADREKFCAGIQGGGGAIAKCLKQHEAELSQGCKDSFPRKKK